MSYYTKITTAGLAFITAAMNNNSKVPITYMAFGDGHGSIPEPDENANSLVNEVYRTSLNKVEVHSKNPNWLVCEAIIPSAVGGFNIREVALFDNTGNTMLAVASYPPTYKPTVEEGAAKIQTIRIVLQVDNTGHFELVIDPDIVLATREYVDEKANSSFIEIQDLKDKKFNKDNEFGRPNSGIIRRIGTIYESKGLVEKPESRVIFHDFRPLIEDGSAFNADGGNMFWGLGAGNFTMKAVPDSEVVAGRDVNLQCSHNLGYGIQALNGLTYGYKNIAVGNNAGRNLKTGAMNVFVGQECARESTNAGFGVYVGAGSGQYSNGNYNVSLGYSAFYNNADGNGCISIGRLANSDAKSGNYNIVIGDQAGMGAESGSYNTLIGKQTANNGINTASNNTVIGSRVAGLEDVNGQVVLADGNGVKYLVANPSGTTQAFADIVGREATPIDLTAADAQISKGTTVKIRNNANIATSFSQIVFQCRVGQPYSRIIQWGGASPKMSFVNNGIESLRINEDGGFFHKITASTALPINNTMAAELVSDSSFRFKIRGSDGVTRYSAEFPLT